MLIRCFIIFSLIAACNLSYAQSKYQLVNVERSKIKFQFIDNLIIIPVQVNGVSMFFLLDSGVSRPILFNIVDSSEALKLKNVETIQLRGLGDGGSVDAIKSTGNVFKIGKAVNNNQEVFIITDETINFTSRLGVPVHGIIGYDILKDFIVEINYGKKFIRLNDPPSYAYKTCKNCTTLPLTFYQNKPYIDVAVANGNGKIPVKLLIDSGGSDALWLFEDRQLGLMPETGTYFIDFFGRGLSGSVHGKKSKIHKFILNDFYLNDVNVAYPDSTAISFARKFKERNGSLGGEILRRFSIIFNYGQSKVTFKKNSRFNDPFEYNKSGIIIEQGGERIVKEKIANSTVFEKDFSDDLSQRKIVEVYKFALKPEFRIVELRPESPAEKAGLKIHDVLLVVNGKDVHRLKINEVNAIFRGKAGKLIRLKIERAGVEMTFSFKLESML